MTLIPHPIPSTPFSYFPEHPPSILSTKDPPPPPPSPIFSETSSQGLNLCQCVSNMSVWTIGAFIQQTLVCHLVFIVNNMAHGFKSNAIYSTGLQVWILLIEIKAKKYLRQYLKKKPQNARTSNSLWFEGVGSCQSRVAYVCPPTCSLSGFSRNLKIDIFRLSVRSLPSSTFRRHHTVPNGPWWKKSTTTTNR